MKRNGDLVKAKKGVKFDSKRADWCTHQNFQLMYQEVYKEIASTGIARKLDSEVFLDKYGNITENEEEGFALKTHCYLEQPDKLIFVDEVGSNTSQANDGNIGGEKLLCIGSNHPQECENTKEAHFAVLGFTTASGEAVMCCIIFAASQLDSLWVQGSVHNLGRRRI